MTKIVWNQAGDRRYEKGLDRGVLYLMDGTSAPWDGLRSISEEAGDPEEGFYFDGVKYLDAPGQTEYSGALTAFTYPAAFARVEGYGTAGVGLYIDDQRPETFDLSYRTQMGDDLNDVSGHRIHLLYNLTAGPDDRQFDSLSDDISPVDLSWSLTSAGETIAGYRPTAHAIIDTSKLNTYLMAEIEDILYGSATTAPRMPSLDELTTMMTNWNLISIVDNGDGTWTASGPDAFVFMLDTTSFQIESPNASYSDADTFTISNTYD